MKKITKDEKETKETKEKKVESPKEAKILPITIEFGHGDLNFLRDKINEIIASK